MTTREARRTGTWCRPCRRVGGDGARHARAAASLRAGAAHAMPLLARVRAQSGWGSAWRRDPGGPRRTLGTRRRAEGWSENPLVRGPRCEVVAPCLVPCSGQPGVQGGPGTLPSLGSVPRVARGSRGQQVFRPRICTRSPASGNEPPGRLVTGGWSSLSGHRRLLRVRSRCLWKSDANSPCKCP